MKSDVIYPEFKSVDVIIDLAKWDRGGIDWMTKRSLLNYQGGMCCLGFACEALGINPERMKGYSIPSSLEGAKNYRKISRLHIITNEAVSANDNSRLSDKRRQAKVKKIFASVNMNVKFVGTGVWKLKKQENK